MQEAAPVDTEQSKCYLFERLLSFLDNEGPLNPVLAGYFSKLMLILIQNKPTDVSRYINQNPSIIDKMIARLESKSVADVLYKLLNLSE